MSVENNAERSLSGEARDKIDVWANKDAFPPDSPAVQEMESLISQMEESGAEPSQQIDC